MTEFENQPRPDGQELSPNCDELSLPEIESLQRQYTGNQSADDVLELVATGRLELQNGHGYQSRDNYSVELGYSPCNESHDLLHSDLDPAIRQVQEALDSQGFSTHVDGGFGLGTQRSVRAFQDANGLEVTGTINLETLNALFPSENPSLGPNARPDSAQLTDNQEQADSLAQVQQNTQHENRVFSGRAEIDDVLTLVASGQLELQNGHGYNSRDNLPVDQGYNPNEGSPDLIHSDLDLAIRAIQTELEIEVDGGFGLGTQRAVMEFQQANRLEVTGTINAETLNSLFPTEESVSPIVTSPIAVTIQPPDRLIIEVPSAQEGSADPPQQVSEGATTLSPEERSSLVDRFVNERDASIEMASEEAQTFFTGLGLNFAIAFDSGANLDRNDSFRLDPISPENMPTVGDLVFVDRFLNFDRAGVVYAVGNESITIFSPTSYDEGSGMYEYRSYDYNIREEDLYRVVPSRS